MQSVKPNCSSGSIQNSFIASITSCVSIAAVVMVTAVVNSTNSTTPVYTVNDNAQEALDKPFSVLIPCFLDVAVQLVVASILAVYLDSIRRGYYDLKNFYERALKAGNLFYFEPSYFRSYFRLGTFEVKDFQDGRGFLDVPIVLLDNGRKISRGHFNFFLLNFDPSLMDQFSALDPKDPRFEAIDSVLFLFKSCLAKFFTVDSLPFRKLENSITLNLEPKSESILKGYIEKIKSLDPNLEALKKQIDPSQIDRAITKVCLNHTNFKRFKLLAKHFDEMGRLYRFNGMKYWMSYRELFRLSVVPLNKKCSILGGLVFQFLRYLISQFIGDEVLLAEDFESVLNGFTGSSVMEVSALAFRHPIFDRFNSYVYERLALESTFEDFRASVRFGLRRFVIPSILKAQIGPKQVLNALKDCLLEIKFGAPDQIVPTITGDSGGLVFSTGPGGNFSEEGRASSLASPDCSETIPQARPAEFEIEEALVQDNSSENLLERIIVYLENLRVSVPGVQQVLSGQTIRVEDQLLSLQGLVKTFRVTDELVVFQAIHRYVDSLLSSGVGPVGLASCSSSVIVTDRNWEG